MIFYWWCCVFNDIEPPGGKKLPEEIAGSRSDGCGVTDKRASPPPRTGSDALSCFGIEPLLRRRATNAGKMVTMDLPGVTPEKIRSLCA